MLALKKIAVTGGLAAGKSTVCSILHELGSYVISADAIVHQLLSPDTTVGQRVVALLGPEILSDHGLDRKKVADKVFSNFDLLRALEKILHPVVLNEIEARYLQSKNEQKYSLFVAEIPLLYEKEWEQFFDTVIAIGAEPAICRHRFKEDRHQEDAEFDRRMKRQLSPLYKATKTPFFIENNGSLEELRQKVLTIYSQLTQPTADPHLPQ